MNAGVNERVSFFWRVGLRPQLSTLCLLNSTLLLPATEDEKTLTAMSKITTCPSVCPTTCPDMCRVMATRMQYAHPALHQVMTGWTQVDEDLRELHARAPFCAGYECLKLQAAQVELALGAGLTCFKLSHIGRNLYFHSFCYIFHLYLLR